MKVVNAHKGIRSFRTTVTGREAHSSRTDKGVNAVMVAAELIMKISDLAEEMRRRGDPSGRFEPPYTTVQSSTIEGGTALNILAHHCTFQWEFRYLPGTSAQRHRRSLRSPTRAKRSCRACAHRARSRHRDDAARARARRSSPATTARPRSWRSNSPAAITPKPSPTAPKRVSSKKRASRRSSAAPATSCKRTSRTNSSSYRRSTPA